MMAQDDSKPDPRALGPAGPGRGRGPGPGPGPWRWGAEARVAAAEACGAALLVALSCLAPPEPARGAAAGATVAMLVQCFDHISGAMFNPAVTAAALVRRRVGAARAACMLAAQLAGAAAGAAVLRAAGAPPCLSAPAPGVAPWWAASVEALAGGCLALANCAAWDARAAARRDSWPLRVGVTVAALSLVAGPISGASINPARSFGPALLAASWDHHWVYWVGPLGGSLAAAALYTALWRPETDRAPY